MDASCGSGEQAVALAGLGLEVTACDPSGGLVNRCKENAKKYGFEKVSFYVSSCMSLELLSVFITRCRPYPPMHKSCVCSAQLKED